MAKTRFFDWYWSTKTPVEKVNKVNRLQAIQDGAQVKGKRIGELPADAVVTVDLAEAALGWLRIIRVAGNAPVPQLWIDAQNEKPVEEREWWIDRSALSEIVVEPDPEPDPEPVPTGREWTYVVTIKEMVKK